MKRIFVYGILQKGLDAPSFGIKNEYYVGRATLYGYSRSLLTRISRSKREDDYVCGDVFEVPDELEDKLFQFENQFGYKRVTTYPQMISDATEYECISYII